MKDDTQQQDDREDPNPVLGVTSKQAATTFKNTLRAATERFRAYRRAITLAVTNVRGLLTWLAVILLLFILHQLFIWVDREPEAAFNQAADFIAVSEIVWDTGAVFANTGFDVLNSAILPLWNGVVFYTVEPFVMLLIEIFSLAFLEVPYPGVLGKNYEYEGFDCTATRQAQEWCGRYSYYATRLTDDDHSAGFADESKGSFRRRLKTIQNRNFTFGTKTARRLSARSLGDDFIIPVFDLRDLTSALSDLTMLFLVLGPIIADVSFGVLYEIFSSSFTYILDGGFQILEVFFEVLKMLVKTGMFSTLVNVGLDFLIVMVTEVALPLLFVAIDGLFCVLNFFDVESWLEQLSCAETTCFQGADGKADFIIFFSVPIVLTQVTKITEALVNSRTAKLFVKSDEELTSKGRTRDPDTGKVIDNEEPDGSESPRPNIEFASNVEDFFFTPSSRACATCFVCKIPEIRALWYLVATIFSIASSTNFYKFSGNVSHACMSGGTFYAEICGPRGAGAEYLPFKTWRQVYRKGFSTIDPRLFDSFASEIHDRGKTTESASAIAAGNAWILRDKSLPLEEQGAQFVYSMCRIMRSSDAGEKFDTGPTFSAFAEGSFSRISAQFLYNHCKRFRHEVAGDGGRLVHDVGYELAACARDDVQCDKDLELCLGSCGGTDSSTLNHDFFTTISLAELGAATLGSDFDSAAANCSVKTVTFDVPLFFGGNDAFKTFAARNRVRSGMTALDEAWIRNNPLSAGVVQRTLERSPGLIFENGVFRHRYDSIEPSPPPPPFPPPKTLFYGPDPPSPPPPPKAPPPYYTVRARIRTGLRGTRHAARLAFRALRLVSTLCLCACVRRTRRTAFHCQAWPSSASTRASSASTARSPRIGRRVSLCAAWPRRCAVRRRALRPSPRHAHRPRLRTRLWMATTRCRRRSPDGNLATRTCTPRRGRRTRHNGSRTRRTPRPARRSF